MNTYTCTDTLISTVSALATHSSVSERLGVETSLRVRSMQVSQKGSISKVREAATATPCLRKHNMDLLIYLPTQSQRLPRVLIHMVLKHEEAPDLDSLILQIL